MQTGDQNLLKERNEHRQGDARYVLWELISQLHRRVEHLCQDVDTLFSSGVGEEYLGRAGARLRGMAAQARILKDALVGELTAGLERLTESQIAAAARGERALRRYHTGLMQPLGEMAQGFKQFQKQPARREAA